MVAEVVPLPLTVPSVNPPTSSTLILNSPFVTVPVVKVRISPPS